MDNFSAYAFNDGDRIDPLMSEREFAHAVGLAQITVRMMRTRGEIPHYRFGRAVRYSREHLEEFLALSHRPATRKREGRNTR